MNYKTILNNIRKNWILSSVVTIVIGLILILFPGQTLTSIAYVVGGVAIAMGVIRTVRYFKQDHTYPFLFQSDLVVGLLTIGMGLFMVSNPKTVMSLLPTIFGLLIIGCGIGNILRANDAKKAGLRSWKLLLALAIITVILGVVILYNPFTVIETAVMVIGAGLLYEGVTDILTALTVGKRIESWRSAI